MLLFESLALFVIFALLDVFLELFVEVDVKLDGKEVAILGFQSVISAVCTLYSASSTRTPLTLQMSFSLLSTLLAPFWKLWAFKIPFSAFKRYEWYLIVAALYIAAFALCLADKLINVSAGRFSAYVVLFFIGMTQTNRRIFSSHKLTLFEGLSLIIVANTQQEKVQMHIPLFEMSLLQSLKVTTMILRRQSLVVSYASMASSAAEPHSRL